MDHKRRARLRGGGVREMMDYRRTEVENAGHCNANQTHDHGHRRQRSVVEVSGLNQRRSPSVADTVEAPLHPESSIRYAPLRRRAARFTLDQTRLIVLFV